MNAFFLFLFCRTGKYAVCWSVCTFSWEILQAQAVKGLNSSITERGRGKRENSSSKTLILKDSRVRSIWTYLTATPCYTTRQREKDKIILYYTGIKI